VPSQVISWYINMFNLVLRKLLTFWQEKITFFNYFKGYSVCSRAVSIYVLVLSKLFLLRKSLLDILSKAIYCLNKQFYLTNLFIAV
jgi:hypothetical protein